MHVRSVMLAALAATLLGVGIALPVGLPATAAQPAERCFPETGHCVGGRFLEYWEANGGLTQQGLPISDQFEEVSAVDGRAYLVQYFERARFEYHPENAAPYDVLLGLLGREQYLARHPEGRPSGGDGQLCFDETLRCIRGLFYDYWIANGGLAQQGLPLSDEFEEVSSVDGRTYVVQYFERARFERHPENAPPYDVLLGHTGREQFLARYPAGLPQRPSAGGASFDAARVRLGTEAVARGFAQPIFVTGAGDGSGRLFVVEKGGTIRTLPGGDLFLDITPRVLSTGGEQGLLGLAFHPRFVENGRFFVPYTDAANGDNVVAQYIATPDRRAGDPASEQRLFAQPDPAQNHNGGMLAFGPDGFLYVGMGDGGGGNDLYRNAQNRNTLLGKILRLDIDGGDPYGIPADNPFAGQDGARPEVWAYGLRNPWRFSFDRASGDLYIGDVGQNRFEWIHHQPAGAGAGRNYGWPILEGSSCLRGTECDRTGLALPVAEYPHDLGCSVTGGYVYRGEAFPILRGAYLYADFCSGRVWTLARDQSGRWVATEKLKTELLISSFGEDERGEVYLTDFNAGVIYRVTAGAGGG